MPFVTSYLCELSFAILVCSKAERKNRLACDKDMKIAVSYRQNLESHYWSPKNNNRRLIDTVMYYISILNVMDFCFCDSAKILGSMKTRRLPLGFGRFADNHRASYVTLPHVFDDQQISALIRVRLLEYDNQIYSHNQHVDWRIINDRKHTIKREIIKFGRDYLDIESDSVIVVKK